MFSTGVQLVFRGGQNFLNWNSFYEKHGGHVGSQIQHYVNNFLGFNSIILKLGTTEELFIL